LPGALVQKLLSDPRIAVEGSGMDMIHVEPSTLTSPITSLFPAGHYFYGDFLRRGAIVATALTIEEYLLAGT
jgi:hypothetical protein